VPQSDVYPLPAARPGQYLTLAIPGAGQPAPAARAAGASEALTAQEAQVARSCPKTWTPSGQADPPASRRRGRRATRPPLATWTVQSSPPLATCTVRLVDASAALPA